MPNVGVVTGIGVTMAMTGRFVAPAGPTRRVGVIEGSVQKVRATAGAIIRVVAATRSVPTEPCERTLSVLHYKENETEPD